MKPKRQKGVIGGLLATLATVVPVVAQVTFSVDMDLGTAGIQSLRAASPGDIFTVGLVLNVGPAGVSSYGISAQFDTTELSLNGSPAAATPALPGGLSSFGPPLENNALGQVYTFSGFTLGLGPASTSFLVGTINYQAVTLVNDGLADIALGVFNLGVDGCFDNGGNAVIPMFDAGYVVPVPEPGSAMLFVFGMLPLWLARHRGSSQRPGSELERPRKGSL
jgi:hypothetical protein